MHLLLIPERNGPAACLSLGRRTTAAIALVVFALIPGLAVYAGYRLGSGMEPTAGTVQAQLAAQRKTMSEAKHALEQNLNALALRLGAMQAHVNRLDAMGQRLTRIGGLADGEFDFTQPPAQGGPELQDEQTPIQLAEFLAQVDRLALTLQNRDQQLEMLEEVMIDRNTQAEFRPAGRPAQSGFISSGFGVRPDPFTGKLAQHLGVDLAGAEGDDVIAVAAGVVIWSGERIGYGNLVEISHGNGVTTRYGHNLHNLVKPGETVRRGQVIARMGSTGRSTGPHVHFEVLHDGRQVNPTSYLNPSS